jgi:sugar-specific transcriptional regulator TrmB
MMPLLHHVELLVRLGLTFTEAKIFLARYIIGTASARTVAETAGVAREVVYQILPTLQEKGLIEIVLTTPQTYKAIQAEHRQPNHYNPQRKNPAIKNKKRSQIRRKNCRHHSFMAKILKMAPTLLDGRNYRSKTAKCKVPSTH